MQARKAEFCKPTRRGRRAAEVEFDLFHWPDGQGENHTALSTIVLCMPAFGALAG